MTMHITFSPIRSDRPLLLERSGDTLIINGKPVDFGLLEEGETLPRDEAGHDMIASDVRRQDGVIHLSVVLPHGSNMPEAVLFPEPLISTEDGQIPLPGDS